MVDGKPRNKPVNPSSLIRLVRIENKDVAEIDRFIRQEDTK